MVVLEAAAITAGGVAAYKGGKAAASATVKSVKKNMKLSKAEKERKDTFNSRKEERKDRFSKINAYRSSLRDVNGNLMGNKREGAPMSSFNWGKSDKKDGATPSRSRGASSSSARSFSASTSRATSSTTDRSSSNPKSSGNWWEK